MSALESNTYSSVYIPKGSYSIQSDIHINWVKNANNLFKFMITIMLFRELLKLM